MEVTATEESARFEPRETGVGIGLFATDRFDIEEVLGVVEGKLIRDPDYGSDYCVALDEHVSIEPGEPFRFLNHSCEPNCEFVVWHYEDTDERELLVQALREIQAGEELTIDYSWPADSAIRCLCGSNACRGWIVNPEELHMIEEPDCSEPESAAL